MCNFKEFLEARAPVVLLSIAKSMGITTVRVLIEDKVYEYDVYDAAYLEKTINLFKKAPGKALARLKQEASEVRGPFERG